MGTFIYAWMIALYSLARAVWSADDKTGEAVASEEAVPRVPKTGV